MRILIDTNVLLSACIFKGKTITNLMEFIFENHKLVLSSSIIDEARSVIAKSNTPEKVKVLEDFLVKVPFDYQFTPDCESSELAIRIRDTNDKHVIVSAMVAQVDILVTGDKDFFDLDYGFEVLTPSDFMKTYAE